MPNHDLSNWQDEREDAAREIAEQYARDVADRGVGPFYRREQPSTAYTPPRDK